MSLNRGYAEVRLNRRNARPVPWQATRLPHGVRFYVAGMRVDLSDEAAESLADALIDTLEQNITV